MTGMTGPDCAVMSHTLTFSRFPLRKPGLNSSFDKNRTHIFRNGGYYASLPTIGSARSCCHSQRIDKSLLRKVPGTGNNRLPTYSCQSMYVCMYGHHI